MGEETKSTKPSPGPSGKPSEVPTSSSSPSNQSTALVKPTTNVFHLIFSRVRGFFGHVRSGIYDKVILKMTTIWYQAVLDRLEPGSTLLDVGIGTAGALIRCQETLRKKNLAVVGIDIDTDYLEEARRELEKANLAAFVSVHNLSIYDLQDRMQDIHIPSGHGLEFEQSMSEIEAPLFDAVYFSGSFSLLPYWSRALVQASQALSDKKKGRIYITQTYRRKGGVVGHKIMRVLKPMLRYIVTIDFGKLIKEEEAQEYFYKTLPSECSIEVVEHSVIDGSIDSKSQAAYMTILKLTEQDLVQVEP